MQKRSMPLSIIALCFGYIGSSISLFQPDAYAREIKAPKSIYSCYAPLKLDNTTVESPVVLATVKHKLKTYYALHPLMADTDPDSFGPLVSIDKESKCNLLTSNDQGKKYFPLNKYVQQEIVRKLYLMVYRDWILQNGKANVNETIAQRKYFDPDQVWALKKMNLQLPPSYKLCAPGSKSCKE
jgi:hypothetical protein